MLLYPYLIIKERLINKVSDITPYWYKDQDLKKVHGSIRSRHSALIRFDQFQTQQLGCDVQSAVVTFNVMLITDTAYDDQDKRLTQTGHPEKANAIYKALDSFAANLSYLSDFSDLAGTNDDYRVINSIRRTTINPDHNMSNLLMTDQQFSCFVKDYAAVDEKTDASGKPLNINNFDI